MNKVLAFYTSLGPIMTKQGQSPGEETHANGTSVGRASFIKKKKTSRGRSIFSPEDIHPPPPPLQTLPLCASQLTGAATVPLSVLGQPMYVCSC